MLEVGKIHYHAPVSNLRHLKLSWVVNMVIEME